MFYATLETIHLRNVDTFARPWALPGAPGLEYRVGGLEKEEGTGNVSYDAANHQYMTDMRAWKISNIANDIDKLEIHGDESADTLVLGWGSTYGGITQAVNRLNEKGVKVVSAFRKGDFIKHFKELNISKFKEGSKDDVCVLSFLGNYLLNKDDVLYTHDQDTHTCHLLNPSIPCDITMGKLVIDVGRIIRTFTQIFPGRIYVPARPTLQTPGSLL